MSHTTLTAMLALASVLAVGAQDSSVGFPPGTRITFLTQDATPGDWDHSGCCGYALEPLQELVRKYHSAFFVRYDLVHLIKEDVPPYYIFNKRYCEPIGRVLDANLFVMTQARLLNGKEQADRWKFDIRAKAYSSITGREVQLFAADNVTIEEAQARVMQGQEGLLQILRAVAGPDG